MVIDKVWQGFKLEHVNVKASLLLLLLTITTNNNKDHPTTIS